MSNSSYHEKERFGTYLQTDLKEKLYEIKDETGAPIARLVNDAIKQFIDNYEEKKK